MRKRDRCIGILFGYILSLVLGFRPAPAHADKLRDFAGALESGSGHEEDSFYCNPLTLLSLLHLKAGVAVEAGSDGDMPQPPSLLIEIRTALQCRQRLPQGALYLTPQLGYSGNFSFRHQDPPEQVGAHLGTLGMGIGYGNRWVALHYVPRWVFGRRLDEGALGFRHGLILRVMQLFEVEAAHQILVVSGRPHETQLQFTVGLNALAVLAGVLYGLAHR